MNFLLHPDKKFRPGEDWIFYAKAVYGKEEIEAVNKVLLEDWLGNGKYTEEFENRVAALYGKKYGLFVNSGSSALLLAYELFNFAPGSEVITPACTFGTTISTMLMKNLVPVLVDSTVGTYNIDIDKIEAAISLKTVAITVPHAVGSVNDMVRLREICDKYRLKLIEDSCDTIGSKLHNKPTGTWSDVTATSFYASHGITAGGGGGMLMTDNADFKRQAKVFRDWGRSLPEYVEGKFEDRYSVKVGGVPYDGKFTFEEVGYNMKGVEMQAVFGLAQLDRLSEFNRIRARTFDQLYRFFVNYEQFFILPKTIPGAEVYWLSFPVSVREGVGFDRQELLRYLESYKIQSRLLFAGNIIRHPAYVNKVHKMRIATPLPNADFVMRNAFLVACHQAMTDEMVLYITSKIQDFLKEKGLINPLQPALM